MNLERIFVSSIVEVIISLVAIRNTLGRSHGEVDGKCTYIEFRELIVDPQQTGIIRTVLLINVKL